MGSKRIAMFLTSAVITMGLLISPLSGYAHAQTVTKHLVKVATSIESKQKEIHAVAPNGRRVYGLNLLVGRDETGRNPIDVEMIGNVNYLNGGGSFFGFITFTAEDGSTLGVQMNGKAKALPNGTDATFVAQLKVLGGTGKWLHAQGKGTFKGSRTAALGAEVKAKFVIRLRTP